MLLPIPSLDTFDLEKIESTWIFLKRRNPQKKETNTKKTIKRGQIVEILGECKETMMLLRVILGECIETMMRDDDAAASFGKCLGRYGITSYVPDYKYL